MRSWSDTDIVVLKGYNATMARAVGPTALGPERDAGDTGAYVGPGGESGPSGHESEPHAYPMPIELISGVADDPSGENEAPMGPMPGIVALGADRSVYSGRGVTVAVLDTGIDIEHDAFAGFKKVDVFDSDDSPQMQIRDFTDVLDSVDEGKDTDGHGTHCTGILCGRAVSGRRIGVADGVNRLLVAKVLGKGANSVRLIDALDWAIGQGAQVISMSLSYNFWNIRDNLIKKYRQNERAGTSDALSLYFQNVDLFHKYIPFKKTLLQSERKQMPLIFAAVGNNSERPSYAVDRLSPSSAPGVLAIGASNGSRAASFSNDNPDLVAPGLGIWSAKKNSKNGLTRMSGTSQACPHTAGLAALYWEQVAEEFTNRFVDPRRRPSIADEVRNRMFASAYANRDKRFPSVDFSEVGQGEPTAPKSR